MKDYYIDDKGIVREQDGFIRLCDFKIFCKISENFYYIY